MYAEKEKQKEWLDKYNDILEQGYRKGFIEGMNKVWGQLNEIRLKGPLSRLIIAKNALTMQINTEPLDKIKLLVLNEINNCAILHTPNNKQKVVLSKTSENFYETKTILLNELISKEEIINNIENLFKMLLQKTIAKAEGEKEGE